MNAESLHDPLPIAIAALTALLVGYALGARRSRRTRRALQRALGARSIELLEARAESARLARRLGDEPRRERLLRFTLARLRESRRRERALFVSEARLRLVAAEAVARTRRAARLPRRVAERGLEAEASANGAIPARAATPCGSVHPARASRSDGAGDLGRVAGLAALDVERLNSLGIHGLEQLAALSEREQLELHERIAEHDGPRPLGVWIGNARALLGRRSPA